ncbi:MAG: transporter [Clostridiales bacterium]|nr:transporter [Clostridiales bacterium]
MYYAPIINQVSILFLIMLIGYIAKKCGTISKEFTGGLGVLLMDITLPSMIITSFNQNFSKQKMISIFIVFICAFMIHLVSLIFGRFLFEKYTGSTKTILKFILIFTNCGYMGFPILESIFGKDGVFYGSIYLIAFNLFLWTAGVMLFSEQKEKLDLKKTVSNPGMIAVFLGLIMFLLSIKLPGPIYSSFDLVGKMTTPLSMIVIGSMLADADFKSIFTNGATYYGSLLRLIIMPVIVLVVLKMIGISGVMLGALVISTAAPAGATTAVFAERYGGDEGFASKIVFISTLLSLITLPGIVLFL